VNGGRATGLRWLGVRTADAPGLARFFHDALAMDVFHQAPGFVALRLPDGAIVEIFDHDDPGHAHFDSGPVAGFAVDNLDRAAAALDAHGVEMLGPIVRGSKGARWLHFRGPDGNVYELLEPHDATGNPD
jgi:catechol 2,3-dioxygenase-like lactoylglutathione lyase family enzyme